jgi:hypothetical protein
MAKYIFLFLIMLTIPSVYALESVTVKLEQLSFQKWKLQGIEVSLGAINNQSQQFGLSIKKLSLPKPFQDLNLVDIRCQQFIWNDTKIHCQQGKASIQSKRFSSPRLNFSFLISEAKTQFTINQFKLLKGVLNLQANLKKDQWTIQLKGKKVALKLVQQLLFPTHKLSSGFIDLSINANGKGMQPKRIRANITLNQLSLQSKDGKKATENLSLKTTLKATENKQRWHWQQESVFKQGNIYFEPLYLGNKNTSIKLKTQGLFDLANQQITLDEVQFTHPQIATIDAYARIELKPKFNIISAKAYAQIESLEQLSKTYLNSVTETTSLEGLMLAGRIDAGITLSNNQADKAYLTTNKLQLKDPKQRFNLHDGVIILNWSKNKDFKESSSISWRQLDLYSIPLPRSYFNLLLRDKQISLLKSVDIPLLGGNIQINKFDWQAMKDNSPKVVFAGKIQTLSLEKLTEILGSKSLSGSISGDIPGVHFEAGKLSLEGGLKINLFGGEININQLALSGLSTDFSQFYSDIEVTDLDLDLLTQKFESGGMKGKLSGFVRELYMENWQPIQFYAWMGTEDDDDSKHQISQKAVENLASIGGGGAVDFVSRIILGMFDNFDYDKMGLGCYLHKGVCQLMGAEAAGTRGYYIVKGGGLPRIDVMGYNTRIDWAVLWKRLNRISQTGNVVVEDPTIE